VRRTTALLLVLALIAAGCTRDSDGTTTTGGASTTGAPVTTAPGTTTTTLMPTGLNLRPVSAFASFPDIPLLTGPPYAGPPTPTSLQGLLWEDQVTGRARETLAANGFVVVSSQIGQFHEAYSNVDLFARQPVFVTSDAAYHYWHLAFSKALRDTEQLVLLPILEDLALALNQAALDQERALAGTAVEPDATSIVRYSELLLALLELEDGPLDPLVEAELSLIRDHLGFDTSPTTGADVDYSLFVPRGHYTRTPELTRFFLAMSSLGLTAFLLREPDQTRTGLMLTAALTGSTELTEMWTQIYEPTAFLVGLADDFTPIEMAQVADEVDPAWRTSAERIDETFLADVVSGLFSLREVAIDPERASMRVMGARFVLDSYILDQLIFPSVSSFVDGVPVGRFEASPLDVAAAFGSDWAYQRQVEAGVPANYPDYDSQMDLMRGVVAGRVGSDWAGTVYDGWLHALQPAWSAHGAAYPDFMRTDIWAAKAHTAGFGSYTELKHDTVLYAKQAFAEGDTPSCRLSRGTGSNRSR
jgi:hypothetical protein